MVPSPWFPDCLFRHSLSDGENRLGRERIRQARPHIAVGMATEAADVGGATSPEKGCIGGRAVSSGFRAIIHLGEPLALVEVLLPARGVLDPVKRKAILRAMQLLIESIHAGMQRRIQLPAASMTQASAQIQQLEGEIEAYQLSIQKTIEARLRQFQGWTFGSLAENQQFAKMVQKILEEHGLRVRCPECGNASILRCANAGNSKNGVFVFDHYLDSGRTFHGGPTTFPAITVVPKPARRIRLNAS